MGKPRAAFGTSRGARRLAADQSASLAGIVFLLYLQAAPRAGVEGLAHTEGARTKKRAEAEQRLGGMSSPLGLYHLAAISLITSRARVGAYRGRGADGYGCTGGAIV